MKKDALNRPALLYLLKHLKFQGFLFCGKLLPILVGNHNLLYLIINKGYIHNDNNNNALITLVLM
uniref:Uncharacterized protein n=1 Tax=Glossina palpalis gambiensis TaxID=67801 RepID=A0A1B0B127_9MUSC